MQAKENNKELTEYVDRVSVKIKTNYTRIIKDEYKNNLKSGLKKKLSIEYFGKYKKLSFKKTQELAAAYVSTRGPG
ncbi:hypothetical protein CKA56_09185, partial [Arcobacter venerupis]|uniref:hypothetical protein n=1 Tax=Arcobacter venerupis TaxID=1054033 RepID=UPI001007C01F